LVIADKETNKIKFLAVKNIENDRSTGFENPTRGKIQFI